MKFSTAICLVLLLCFQACQKPDRNTSTYRFELEVKPNIWLPFIIDFNNEGAVSFNGEEKVEWTVTKKADSTILTHKVYPSQLRFAVGKTGRNVGGYWYNLVKGVYKMKLRGTQGNKRFVSGQEGESVDVGGKWETRFSGDEKALGVFKQDGKKLTATFLTETGDYRYLEGIVDGSRVMLSVFDGAHAFLFDGFLKRDSIYGTFYSGNHWKTDWKSWQTQESDLGDPFALTTQDSEIDFTKLNFQNIDSEDTWHRLVDKMYEDKAVMIQIMGTWCPNCYDETRYYKQLYEEHAKDGLEILAVCFEYPKDVAKAKEGIQFFKKKMQVPYAMVYGGEVSKKNASAAFPFLNQVISYPTTLFFNKDHELIKIHTGFSGPATGEVFVKYKQEMKEVIKGLVSELP